VPQVQAQLRNWMFVPLDLAILLKVQGVIVCSTLRCISCRQAKQFQSKVIALKGRADVLPIALSHADINQQLGLESDYTNQVEEFLQGLGLS